MSFPTPFSPWFVVQRMQMADVAVASPETPGYLGMEYYVSDVEIAPKDDEQPNVKAEPDFSDVPERAQVFTNLSNAARVARYSDAHVRALTSREELSIFRK